MLAGTILRVGPQKDHLKIRILPIMVSGIPLILVLGTRSQILMSMWSFGPL